MSEFEVDRSNEEVGGRPISVLHLKGQLDAHTFATLQDELSGVSSEEPAPRVVLDCADLEYVSSAGLGVLKKMTREFRDREGDLRLAALPPKIASVMSLLGFDRVIKVFTDRKKAVESFDE